MTIVKLISMTLFPLGLLQILVATNILGMDLGFDVGIIGAAVMISVQVLTMMIVRRDKTNYSFMNIVSFTVFAGFAAYYMVTTLIKVGQWQSAPLIIGVMMFLEGMYAMH